MNKNDIFFLLYFKLKLKLKTENIFKKANSKYW